MMAGVRRTPGWLGPVLAVLVFFVVFISGGLFTADWGVRNVEMRNLVSAVEASEAAMTTTQEQVSNAFAPFDIGGPLTPEETELLRQQLTTIARDARVSIEQAGIAVAEVDVQPWHRAIKDAQLAYLVHNQAWVRYMEAAAQDPVEFINPQPLVNETFELAEPIMKRAVPQPPLFDLQARVAQIFIDGSPEEEVPEGSST
jgi:hypothetical protein